MSVAVTQELSFAAYQERQLAAITEEGVKKSLLKAKCSDKFTFERDHWVKHPYPGYAVVSMLENNPDNHHLSNVLQALQADLIWETKLNNYLFQLPAPSFHQTIANTLSAERFLTKIRNNDMEHTYPFMIEAAFQNYMHSNGKPIRMKICGISIFGSSLGVLGTFESEEDFKRVITFRNHFYADTDLANLGIKWTRPFIGHITLAYFGKSLIASVQEKLYAKINELNLLLAKEELFFNIEKTELRRYDELSVFQNLPFYPSVKL